MSKIDPQTRKILDFIRDWLRAVPHGKLSGIAKACKVDGATLSRLHDKDNPNYHPKLGTVLRILAEITGKFPLEIKDNFLLSKLPSRGNGEIFDKLLNEAMDLKESDIDLLVKFLAVLKNRNILNPEHFKVLTIAMSWLQEELVEKKGTKVFAVCSGEKEAEASDELN